MNKIKTKILIAGRNSPATGNVLKNEGFFKKSTKDKKRRRPTFLYVFLTNIISEYIQNTARLFLPSGN